MTTAFRAQRTQPTICLVPLLWHFQDITLNRLWEQTHLIYSWMNLSDLQGIDKRSFVNMEKKLFCMLKVFYKDSSFQISEDSSWKSLDQLPSITSNRERYGTRKLGVTAIARRILQNKISALQLHRNCSEIIFRQSYRWWHENEQF